MKISCGGSIHEGTGCFRCLSCTKECKKFVTFNKKIKVSEMSESTLNLFVECLLALRLLLGVRDFQIFIKRGEM